METLKKAWAWIVGIIGAGIGIFMLRDFFQKDLKAELKNANTSKEDALLEQRKQDLFNKEQELKQDNNAETAKLNQAKDAAKKANSDQIEDFWKKN